MDAHVNRYIEHNRWVKRVETPVVEGGLQVMRKGWAFTDEAVGSLRPYCLGQNLERLGVDS